MAKFGRGNLEDKNKRWFITRFLGNDNEINLDTRHPEFIDWKWIDPNILPEVIVDFKKDLYLDLLKEINLIIN